MKWKHEFSNTENAAQDNAAFRRDSRMVRANDNWRFANAWVHPDCAMVVERVKCNNCGEITSEARYLKTDEGKLIVLCFGCFEDYNAN